MRNFVYALALALIALAGGPAFAQTRVDITSATYDPMPIATLDFFGDDRNTAQIGKDIASVIRADLDRSGLFRSTDPASFIERIEDINIPPRMADWRVLGSQAVVVGRVSMLADGRASVAFRLWDTFAEQEMVIDRPFVATPPDNWRRAAHHVADLIYEKLTGERGYFDTRIVFVSESGPRTRRVKRLMIMDQDGANPFYLTGPDAMVLTPRFSPTRNWLTYMSFETGAPRVFLFDIDRNRREMLGQFEGMTFAPRFSPDGTKVVFTIDLNGNSEIFIMDLNTHQRTRLTNHPAIDTAPSFSPDGAQITFESDRGGSQQIYVMNADGSGVHRISFADGRYGTPVWSPRGDLIAFTRQQGGRFSIGVMHPDGSGERILTDAYLEESPTWSPNGRVIIFFRQDGPGAGPKLWSIDLTGRNLRQVPTPTDASDPAWSPFANVSGS